MILTQNKLTGENYVDWKRNLDIVLTAENHKMVLIKPCPIELIEESDKEEKKAYKTWMRSDEIARCYILASMNNVLQQQHSHFETAKSMMNNLADMFGDQTRQAKQAARSLEFDSMWVHHGADLVKASLHEPDVISSGSLPDPTHS